MKYKGWKKGISWLLTAAILGTCATPVQAAELNPPQAEEQAAEEVPQSETLPETAEPDTENPSLPEEEKTEEEKPEEILEEEQAEAEEEADVEEEAAEGAELPENFDEMMLYSRGLPDYTEKYGWKELDHQSQALSDDLETQAVGSGQKKLTYLAVFVEFPDMEDYHLDDEACVKNAENYLNDGVGTVTGPLYSTLEVTSLREYVERCSYGSYTVKSWIFPKVDGKVVSYMSEKPRSYYMPYNAQTNPDGYESWQQGLREQELLSEVLKGTESSIKASGLTASDLDVGGDGFVDAISFFVEERGVTDTGTKAQWGNLLWSHKADAEGLGKLLGKDIGTYNLINTYDYRSAGGTFSSNRPGYATIIHEYMHSLGFPDLYRYADTEGTQAPVGAFDIMASTISCDPQPMLTYMLSNYNRALGWREPLQEITSSTEITLKKPGYQDKKEKSAVIVRSPLNAEQYFVIDYHNKHTSGNAGDSTGVLVYRINERFADEGNRLGVPGYDAYGYNGDFLYIFRGGESGLNAGGGNMDQAVLNTSRSTLGKNLGEETAGFDNGTVSFADGGNSGIVLRVTAQTEDTITLSVSIPTLEGNGTKDKPYLISTPQDFISILKGNPGKYYRLLSDLDFTDVKYESIDMSGYLDGNNHVIRNVTVSGSGLFGDLGSYGVSTAVSDLILENITVMQKPEQKYGYTGILAGSVAEAEVKNVLIKSGTVCGADNSTGFSSVGGFVGQTSSAASVFINCGTYADVTGGLHVGGFIGLNQSAVIQNCFAAGSLSNGNTQTGSCAAGGFIARQYDTGSGYKIPVNACFDAGKAGTENAVGMQDKSCGAQGITAVRVPEELEFRLDEELEITAELFGAKLTSSETAFAAADEEIAVVLQKTSSGYELEGKKAGETEGTYTIYLDKLPMNFTVQLRVLPRDGEPGENPGITPMIDGWNTVEKDGVISHYYKEAKSGRLLTGWQVIERKKCWFDRTGALAEGPAVVDGKRYLFGALENGTFGLQTGYFVYEDTGYCADAAGVLRIGWIKTDGTWRFFSDKSSEELDYGQEASAEWNGNWVSLKETGDRYYFKSGKSLVKSWQTIDKKKYYFDKTGIMETGLTKIGTALYYFSQEEETAGVLQTGEFSEAGQSYYAKKNGALNLGWQKIGDVWYYYDMETGARNEDAQAEEGWVKTVSELGSESWYYLEKGKWAKDWKTIAGLRRYFNSSGVLQTGFFRIGSKTYYGMEDEENRGAVSAGPQVIDGKTYLFNKDGVLQTGWKKQEDGWHLYAAVQNENTVLGEEIPVQALEVENGFFWYEAGGKKYCFQKNSSLCKGWKNIGSRRVWFDSTGCLQTGDGEAPVVISKKPYLFTADGSLGIGWIGDTYYADSKGVLKSGWQKIEGEWYYFDQTSYKKLQTGAIKASSFVKVTTERGSEEYHYFSKALKPVTGWQTIDGKKYYFLKSGARATYLTAVGSKQYYFGGNGVMRSNTFLKYCGNLYYFGKNGDAARGWKTIAGKKYYFDTKLGFAYANGVYRIGGKEYFFDGDGNVMAQPVLSEAVSKKYGTVFLRWKAEPRAENYLAEYSRTSDFKVIEGTIPVPADETSVEIRDLDPGIKYYFRIRYVLLGEKADEKITSCSSKVLPVMVQGEIASSASAAKINVCTLNTDNELQIEAETLERIRSEDEFFYLVAVDAGGKKAQGEPLAYLEKAEELVFRIPVLKEQQHEMLMNRYALAVRTEKGYVLVSGSQTVAAPELAANKALYCTPASKKGIQGALIEESVDSGTKNTLWNLDLGKVVGDQNSEGFVPFVYKGETYYFSPCESEVYRVAKACEGPYTGQYDKYEDGYTGQMNFSMVVLLSWHEENKYLIDPAARRKGAAPYYMLNTREQKARDTLEAVFVYLGELFSREGCYVSNWILGNELNSCRAWNYIGGNSYADYMSSYCNAFQIMYNGIRQENSAARFFISLDNGWNAAPAGFTGKSFLDRFAACMAGLAPELSWNVAYHPYSAPLTRVDYWNDSGSTKDKESTAYISMKNITVLTEYLAEMEKKYGKAQGSIRVILSEQGWTAKKGENKQAYAIALGYYTAQFNDRIDAFIIRAETDDLQEMRSGLYFGLRDRQFEKREAYYVYKYMDTPLEVLGGKTPGEEVTAQNIEKYEAAQKLLGDTEWENLVSGFDEKVLAQMPIAYDWPNTYD